MPLFKKSIKAGSATLVAAFVLCSLSLAQVSAAASSSTPPDVDPAIKCTSGNCNLIPKYVNPLINSLSVAFGLIAVISLILGGIQFTASEGDPQKAAQAKHRISNTILAIFVYSLLYGFIQFLVPGGLFH